MYRNLKYRVWDNEKQEFFKPIYEAYKGNLLDLSIGLSGDIMRRTLDIPCEHESCFPNRYVVQLFSGLKDKNGKEIYEGDILKGLKGNIFVCKYLGSGFKFSQNNGKRVWSSSSTKSLKIIGNIYEHNHLIDNN